MLQRTEIEAKAKEFEITIANVQRDYVFGWVLFGLFTVSGLKDHIFLKGGNALRKAYLADTRFSADLDLGTAGDIPEPVLRDEFGKVCSFVQERSGVMFQHDQAQIKEKFTVTDSPLPDLKVYEIRLYFQDFYGNKDHLRIRISIDLTRYDKVLLPIATVPLIHPYSDAGELVCSMRCMKLEEIIATKLKCLLQRQHAPDLFDYVYAVRRAGGQINRRELVTTFIRKTIFDRNPHVAKEILLKTPFQFFREYWDKTIVCAKQVVIGVDEAIQTFIADLNDLFSTFPDSGFRSFAYFNAEQRIPIMEAGRAMTCLKIVYGGYERVVEPYSLRYLQRRDGVEREYLYVYDRVGGNSGPGIKAMVAEKLTRVECTGEPFEPRFPVDLSKAGEMPEDHYLFDPNKPKRAPSTRRSSQDFRGPIYIYRCSVCGRQFRRREMDNAMNAHKGKNGYPCYGSYGVYCHFAPENHPPFCGSKSPTPEVRIS